MQEMHGVSHRASQGISVCVHVTLMFWKDDVGEGWRLDVIVMNGSAEDITTLLYRLRQARTYIFTQSIPHMNQRLYSYNTSLWNVYNLQEIVSAGVVLTMLSYSNVDTKTSARQHLEC